MESVSRLSSMLEAARDLTIDAAQAAGSARTYVGRSRELSSEQLKKLLDSKFDKEVLEGLRKVVSMIYQNKPCLTYFSAVVKNVASPNIEIKKLVYIFILYYAEAEPDLALLSINTIQKSLSDQNAQVRAMALRVMSGIRVPVISQIVSLAIKRGCADMSPHVRKAAALAIPKCYSLDPGTLPQLLDYISILLGDKQYFVVGSAVSTFLQVCPERIDLIHKHYRGIVRKLVDMDEWGQLAVIRLLTIYARKCFPRPSKALANSKDTEFEAIDPDLKLFLNSCRSLLSSRNAAVIVAATRVYVNLASAQFLDDAIPSLVALLRSPQNSQQVILYNLVTICLIRPHSLAEYFDHFLVRAQDSLEIIKLKLELLTLIFPKAEHNVQGLILNELEHFTKANDADLVRESVRAIGRCARSAKETATRCMNLLLQQASSPDGTLVAEALTVVRHLIQQDPASHDKTIIRLAKNLDTMTNADARASIIWLVGEYSNPDPSYNIAPDVLRILLQGFADEAKPAKLQVVLLAAKVYLQHLVTLKDRASGKENGVSQEQTSVEETPDPIAVLWDYTLLLARYDVSYDLRDRARMYKALLEDASATQLASLVLRAPKPPPHNPSPSEARKDFLLGSASLVIGVEAGSTGLLGYESLPEWVYPGDEPNPELRNELERNTITGIKPALEEIDTTIRPKDAGVSATATVNREKTLDDWLAEEDHQMAPAVEEDASEDAIDSSESEEETEEETEEDTDDEDNEERNTLLTRTAGS